MQLEERHLNQEEAPRRDDKRRPTLTSVSILFIVIVLLLITSGLATGVNMVYEGVLINEWLLILLPSLAFLHFHGLAPRRYLRIVPLRPKSTLGVILAAVSGILLTGELVTIQNDFLPIPAGYLEMMRNLFTISGREGIVWALLAFTVSPAICEEILFRGIILQETLRRFSRPSSIIITGILFGLFHLDPYRFLGTAVLGCIMAYLVTRVDSLLASMTYHLTNNLMILLTMNLVPFRNVAWLTEETHLPVGVFLLSIATFFLGIHLSRPPGGGPHPPGEHPGTTGNIYGTES
jgi:membrane protease YdiL (CAAX protease family)